MIVNYFMPEPPELLAQWDGEIKMAAVKGCLSHKQLLEPIPCGNSWIPLPFKWDGSSNPRFLSPLIPKWRHPVFSAKHDFRCKIIRQLRRDGMSWREAMKLRKIADKLGREDIMIGQKSKLVGETEAFIAYIGVRLGAYIGAGMRPEKE